MPKYRKEVYRARQGERSHGLGYRSFQIREGVFYPRHPFIFIKLDPGVEI